MDIIKIIHENYLERKASTEYLKILNRIIAYEKELRKIMTNEQQLLLSKLLADYQELQLLDQPELIKFVLNFKEAIK